MISPSANVMLAENKLSMGHARALLSLPEGVSRVEAAKKIADEGLTVRAVEALAKEDKKPEKKKKTEKESVYPDVERMLCEKYGTKVKIKGNRKGKIENEYYSVKDLTRIVDLLG